MLLLLDPIMRCLLFLRVLSSMCLGISNSLFASASSKIIRTCTETARDQELEESFSFSSCYDFNSSSFQSIFSDESDDESYIEIALEQKNYHGDIDDWADEEMELRISFSSSAPFQEPSSTTTSIEYEPAATMSKSPSSSSTTTTSTMNPSSPSKEGDQWDAQMGSKASNSTFRIQKTIKRKAQFPKVHGFLNMLKPSLTVSSEANDENGRPANSNHLELVRPRPDGRSVHKNGKIFESHGSGGGHGSC
ncbi:uncharacterized protein [Populus alba]|uniref:uncharacterized protein isoform X2 n=1 Tax=Populus alba TaxID=43335 RepID=UPI003CC78DC3